MNPVHIIGGGLGGSEAAWQVVQAGIPVVLHEMRPEKGTEAHQTDRFAELVCSNSLRSDDSDYNAVGLLHDEMRRCGSIIMDEADRHKVPAGGALAVDRNAFSDAVTQRLLDHPLITIVHEEVCALPERSETLDSVIIASGPLTSTTLAESIQQSAGVDSLSFFDAIAPIVYRESINMSKAWMQSRYDKAGPGGTGADYINCAMDKEQYGSFVQAILDAPKIEFKEWEKTTPYFDGCLPIEIMAKRGLDTLRYGPMKPVGLTNPHLPGRSYAIVQLRQDNKQATLYNLVGFQTKMKYAEQLRVFRMIPGLENAEFARMGGLHRNTFLNSPLLLDRQMRFKAKPHIRFAGQMTGVEGYVESAATGLLAGMLAVAEKHGRLCEPPPRTTAIGALVAHITGEANADTFQPMNVNFGLFPPITEGKGGRDRKLLYTKRAKIDFETWRTHQAI